MRGRFHGHAATLGTSRLLQRVVQAVERTAMPDRDWPDRPRALRIRWTRAAVAPLMGTTTPDA